MSNKILVLVPSKNYFKVSGDKLLEKFGFLPGIVKNSPQVIFEDNKFKYRSGYVSETIGYYYVNNDNVFSISFSNMKKVLINFIAKSDYNMYLEDLLSKDDNKFIETFKKLLEKELSGQKFALLVIDSHEITEF